MYCIFGSLGVPRGLQNDSKLDQVGCQRSPDTILATSRGIFTTWQPPRGDLGALPRPSREPRGGSRGPAERASKFGGGGTPATSGENSKSARSSRHPGKRQPSRPSHTTPNVIRLAFGARAGGSANERRNIEGGLYKKLCRPSHETSYCQRRLHSCRVLFT